MWRTFLSVRGIFWYEKPNTLMETNFIGDEDTPRTLVSIFDDPCIPVKLKPVVPGEAFAQRKKRLANPF